MNRYADGNPEAKRIDTLKAIKVMKEMTDLTLEDFLRDLNEFDGRSKNEY